MQFSRYNAVIFCRCFDENHGSTTVILDRSVRQYVTLILLVDTYLLTFFMITVDPTPKPNPALHTANTFLQYILITWRSSSQSRKMSCSSRFFRLFWIVIVEEVLVSPVTRCSTTTTPRTSISVGEGIQSAPGP